MITYIILLKTSIYSPDMGTIIEQHCDWYTTL